MNEQNVPAALRTWFGVHFVADVAFAIPLMLAPEFTLRLFGWQTIDPIATRIVAAALFAIGIESWLGRNAGIQAYRNMLNLKIIWSAAVVLGAGASLLAGAQGAPLMGWAVMAVFLFFNLVWVYWRRKLK
jgi:hypothetical protein